MKDREEKPPPVTIRRVLLTFVALVGLASLHCGSVSDDPGTIDATVTADATPTPDAPVTPSVPNTQFQTSGGGASESANYKLQLKIGAPQPMGEATSSNYKVRIGPVTP